MRGSHSTRCRLLMAGHSTNILNGQHTFPTRTRQRVECPEQAIARRVACPEQAIARRGLLRNYEMNPESGLSSLPTLHPPSAVPGHAFVYILACKDDSSYIGSAYDVAKRLAEHAGHRGAKFTRDRPGATTCLHRRAPFSPRSRAKGTPPETLASCQEAGLDPKSDRTPQGAELISWA